MILSEKPLTYKNQHKIGWKDILIPSSGIIDIRLGISQYTYLDKTDYRTYEMKVQPILDWGDENESPTSNLNDIGNGNNVDKSQSRIVSIRISSDEAGLHDMVEVGPDIIAIMGVLAGLFAYVGLAFSCFFSEPESEPEPLEPGVATSMLLYRVQI